MRNVIAPLAALFALTGCASIFNGTTQAVTIKSTPEASNFAVTNRAGEKIHAGTTPATLTLKRGHGYFKSETYTVVLTKEGYSNKELTIVGTMSGWYIGNILFGGLIGMLAVDPVTGAMYTFPETVSATLEPAVARTSSASPAAAETTLTIVSTDSLTPEQKQAARLVVAQR